MTEEAKVEQADALVQAIESAGRGYSIRLTRLVDDEATYTLTYRGEITEHDSHEDASERLRQYAAAEKREAAAAFLSSHPDLKAERDALVQRQNSRLQSFSEAVEQLPWVSEGLINGKQFNAYDSADNDEDTDDDDCEMIICLGPITDALGVCRVTGRAKANMIADALTLAAALRALQSGAAGEVGNG